MPLEIEIKLQIPTHIPILKILRQLGAKHTGKHHETNIFFDRPDRSLRAKSSGLRVRLEFPVTSNRKSKIRNRKYSAALLTFKGPPQKTGLHSRNAYDLSIIPADQLIPLLNALGFHQTHLFEKIRDSWELHHCRVELDTLPHFGYFLEIEGPSQKSVRSVQKMLRLDSLQSVKPSYAKMVADHLQHFRKKELRF